MLPISYYFRKGDLPYELQVAFVFLRLRHWFTAFSACLIFADSELLGNRAR